MDNFIYKDIDKLLKISKEVNPKELKNLIDNWEGVGNNLKEEDVDPEELKLGIAVEMEHTSNKELAKRIALDHIFESMPISYYNKLKKLEEEIKKEKNE